MALQTGVYASPALFMNRPALFTTFSCESSCGYLAQNTAQISRHALASGLRNDSRDRAPSALRLMNNSG